jgi:hypothetical protein
MKKQVCDEDRVRELAAEFGCSLWTDGAGRYRLEGDKWGPLFYTGTTLEEIKQSILFGANFHLFRRDVEKAQAKQTAEHDAAQVKQKRRVRSRGGTRALRVRSRKAKKK